ncbi:competence protein ComK [Sporolactobacillus sp. KGMB 08714]|uniref:competence protein ComK n=1 Tax=Sporolactobacillus sp. KGMB 08714 TaxID=3064704 RepID=UPI002FBD84EE
MDQYIISQKTMALLPYDSPDGSLQTWVIEEERILSLPQTPYQVLHYSCGYFGSTFSGRKKGAVSMGYKSMPPICICSELGLYFFSLMSEARRECVWLSHTHIRDWRKCGERHVMVHLMNGRKIPVPVQLNVFQSKLMRAAQFRYQLCERMAPRRSANEYPEMLEVSSAEHLIINERGTYSICEKAPAVE